jgi:hypothetical protein
LPDPVTPSSVWKDRPSPRPSTSAFIASGWSPVGLNGDDISKFMHSSLLIGNKKKQHKTTAARQKYCISFGTQKLFRN